MSGYGQTIRIYLADGTPTGIRYAELVNWTGQALVCPRGRIGELAKWEEAQRPGVYFLVGDDESESRSVVYVGEAENVLLRLQTHLKNKDFWSRVVLFTSKDENVNKSHVRFLEARLVEMANKAGRVRLENGNAPQLPTLPRPDRDAMEDFLDRLRVLLGALGFPILQPVAAKPEEEQAGGTSALVGKRLRFVTPRGNVDATGAVTDEGFVVFEGSAGEAKLGKSLGKAYRAHREQLLADGSLVEQGGTTKLTRDVLFTSPSAAAAVLAGSAQNGRVAWKDGTGVSLKELEEQLAEQSEEGEHES